MKENEITLYEFKGNLPFLVHGEAHIIVGKWSDIKNHFSFNDLNSNFDGYLQGLSPDHTYLGVWSARMCSRFKRILLENGASLKVESGLPHPEFKIIKQVRHGA